MSSQQSLRNEHRKTAGGNVGLTSVTPALSKERWMMFRSIVTPLMFLLIFSSTSFAPSLLSLFSPVSAL